MDSIGLQDLNIHIRQVIALNFSEPIWINCEIAQIGESRGNRYLELIEKSEDNTILAKASAAIWNRDYLTIKNKLGNLTNNILSVGTKVLIKVLVTTHEIYGMKLSIMDIDPSYTMGIHEMEKNKIIERLKSENLLQKNGQLKLPMVIQKIAVLSSKTAAGYEDFITQLRDNDLGYDFDLCLFNIAVQGINVESEIVAALKEIYHSNVQYDAIIIIRGGGSKMDLACFDNYKIATAIAYSKHPVLSGIGHEIDDVIVDLVAHKALKTPTAVANFILDRNMLFESQLIETYRKMEKMTSNALIHKKLHIENLSHRLDASIKIWLGNQKNKLDLASKIIEMSHPEKILAKGFFTIKHNRAIITDITDLKSGETIEIESYNQSRKAIIK